MRSLTQFVSRYINPTMNDYLKHSASDWHFGFDIIAFSMKNFQVF